MAGYDNHCIQVFSTEGHLLCTWKDCQFHHPYGLVVDNQRNLIVTGRENHRVLILSY